MAQAADDMRSNWVSTHSHPKVAEIAEIKARLKGVVSTHSHPKVADIA